jgi:hypothetical protein
MVLMSTHALIPNREADIWARLMRAQSDTLSTDVAQFLLSIDFDDEDRKRMLELSQRSEAGTLSGQDQAEFDSYLHVGNFLAIMRSKARLALKSRAPRPS